MQVAIIALPAGLHLCYNGDFSKMQWSDPAQIYKNFLSPVCFMKLENNEGGIASNRRK